MDVVESAQAFPLIGGVVFRWPVEPSGVMMLASLGKATPAPDGLQTLPLAQFRRAVGSLSFFGYRGCDRNNHYFCLPSHRGLCVSRRELAIEPMSIELGFCLFVAFRAGTLTVADPEIVSTIDPQACRWTLGW